MRVQFHGILHVAYGGLVIAFVVRPLAQGEFLVGA
jgi:hypothetical protein